MPALELYAPDKGRISRWILGVSAVLLVAYGAYSIYYVLPEGARRPIIDGFAPLGTGYPVSWALLLSVLFLGAGAFGSWWAINYAKLVDFLHDTEVELHKVSWASKSDVISSAIVVIVTTVVLAGWVFIFDLLLIGLRTLWT